MPSMLLLVDDNNNDSMSDENNVQNGQRTTTEQDHRQRYEQFVEALENSIATSSNSTITPSFEALAVHLGWEVEDVQLYAYQYFVSLCEADGGPTTTTTTSEATSSPSNGQAWTPQEVALFDTLMARYYEPSSDESLETQIWAERVAEHLPGKTAADVRRRFLQLQEEERDED